MKTATKTKTTKRARKAVKNRGGRPPQYAEGAMACYGVRLPQTMLEALHTYAGEAEVSTGEVIRKALDSWLPKSCRAVRP